jgi:hypothetical protein
MRMPGYMKTTLNLTIDDNLPAITKIYARQQNTSISELVENYLKAITKPVERGNIIDLIEQLDKARY